MNHSTAVFLINDDVIAVDCIYEPDTPDKKSKRTTFKTFDRTITKGDIVVVETNTRHGYTICEVAETDVEVDIASHQEMHWVVDTLDLSQHEQTISAEKKAIEKIKSAQKRKERDELRKALLADTEELETLTIEAPASLKS